MSNLVGNPEDRFSHETIPIDSLFDGWPAYIYLQFFVLSQDHKALALYRLFMRYMYHFWLSAKVQKCSALYHNKQGLITAKSVFNFKDFCLQVDKIV